MSNILKKIALIESKIQNIENILNEEPTPFNKIKQAIVARIRTYIKKPILSTKQREQKKEMKRQIILLLTQYYKDRYGEKYLEKTNYNDVVNHFDSTLNQTLSFLLDKNLTKNGMEKTDSMIDQEKLRNLAKGYGQFSGVANGSGRGTK